MNTTALIDRFFEWRRQKLSERTFILIASAVVGLVAALSAVGLKVAVHFVHQQLASDRFEDNYYQFLYPVIGLLLTVFVAKHLYKSGSVGHAISDVLYSISKKRSKIYKGKMYSRWLTSVLTVGFGGSVGLESPIVLTGAAIGSNIGLRLRMDYKQRTLLLGCGVGGAISAIFNAPVAGLMFAIEVILTGLSVSNFIPLFIACVSATVLSQLLVGDEILFTAVNLVEELNASEIPYIILLGMGCGVVATLFNRFLHWVEHWIEEKKANMSPYFIALAGGIVLSGLIFVTPPVYGEGYSMIEALLHNEQWKLLERSELFGSWMTVGGWMFLAYLIITIGLKIVATSVTLSSGGSGGTFAPSMLLGALTGFATARMLSLMGIAEVSAVNFTLIGMSGVLCGIQYAPLTAIFLIAEITGGYTLFMPLMLVSAISYLTVTFFEPDSPYVRALKERGEYVHDHDDDAKVLERLNINKTIETDLQTVPYDGCLGDLVKVISCSNRNLYPVVDEDNKLKGIVTLDGVRDIMFDHDKHEEVRIKTLTREPRDVVYYGERMIEVMEKFEVTNAWNLPVIDQEGHYIGVLSKSRIFGVYRKQLIRLNKNWIYSG